MVRTHWLPAAILAGVAYVVIGRAFAVPTANVQAWRLAAWAASGVVLLAHIWFEHTRPANRPVQVALRASIGAAFGGFGLAVAGMMHSMADASQIRVAWLLALVLWPLITAIPAYCVAFVIAMILRRAR